MSGRSPRHFKPGSYEPNNVRFAGRTKDHRRPRSNPSPGPHRPRTEVWIAPNPIPPQNSPASQKPAPTEIRAFDLGTGQASKGLRGFRNGGRYES